MFLGEIVHHYNLVWLKRVVRGEEVLQALIVILATQRRQGRKEVQILELNFTV